MNASELHKAATTAGVTLFKPAAPVANYLPAVFDGRVLWISGQLPFEDGKITKTGVVGSDVPVEQAALIAKVCAVNILSQLHAFLESSGKSVSRALRLGGFVVSSASFNQHSAVMNGASDLLVAVLGDAGKHARTSIGVASLPLNAPVEVEAQFLIA